MALIVWKRPQAEAINIENVSRIKAAIEAGEYQTNSDNLVSNILAQHIVETMPHKAAFNHG